MMMINAYPQSEKRLEQKRRIGVTPTTFFEVLRIREFARLLIVKSYFWLFTALVMAVLISQTALLPEPYSATAMVRISSALPSNEFYSERFSVETEIDVLRSYDLIGKALDEIGYTALIYPKRTKFGQLASIEPTGIVRKVSGIHSIPLIDSLQATKTSNIKDLTRGHTYTVRYVDDEIHAFNEGGVLITQQPIGKTLPLDIGDVDLSDIDYQPKWDYELMVFDRHNMIRYIQSKLEIRPEPLKLGGGLIHAQLTMHDRLFVDHFLETLLDQFVLQGENRVKGDILESISALEEKRSLLNEEILRYSDEIEVVQQDFDIVDPKYDANKLTEQILITKKSIDELEAKRAKLLRDVTPLHPTIGTIGDKISMERKLLADLTDKLQDLPNVSRVIKTNQILIGTAENNLITLNAKLVQLKSYLTMSKNYVDKVQSPTPRHKPYRSKLVHLFVLSGIFGAIAGMFIIIVNGSNKVSKVKTDSEVSANTRLPIFCHLRLNNDLEQEPRDSAGRLTTWDKVAGNIPYLFVGGSSKPIVIQTTSAHPINYHFVDRLADAHAQDNKCLVIDFDFQRRLFSKFMGVEDSVGALEVLAGVKTLEDGIVETEAGYSIIPAGNGLAAHSIEEIVELAHTLVQQASLSFDQIFVVMPADPKSAIVGSTFGCVIINAAIGVTTQQFKQLLRDYDREDRASALMIMD